VDEYPAIGDLAFLSDCRSGALVDYSGAVVWWCPEQFDGDAWFARLLDRRGGVWSITPRSHAGLVAAATAIQAARDAGRTAKEGAAR
jgi:GH15 family glucan-1,4-alpha-glucosidase